MFKNVIQVYKKCGETPLDCINTLKKDNEELRFVPMTYAGRLDPLAEGVLLILVGDECLKKDEYLALSKEYEVDILFGFATDTYDVMGKVLEKRMSTPSVDTINNSLKNFTGHFSQSYPPYSSRPVKGKQLFKWAREGKLDEIEIPSHDVFVEGIQQIEWKEISGRDLFNQIKKDIEKVKGDFRQDEILSIWDSNLMGEENSVFKILKLKISCGSGVYVRAIANDIGKKLRIPSLAIKIKRTRVGEFTL